MKTIEFKTRIENGVIKTLYIPSKKRILTQAGRFNHLAVTIEEQFIERLDPDVQRPSIILWRLKPTQ